MHGETKDVRLEELVSFKDSQEQACESGWVQQLIDCIESARLMEPAIVRPADGGKYQVISGHNRIKALKLLGCESVHADIRSGLSDDGAEALYHDSRLSQQPFSSCSYSQKFEIVKHYEKFMNENSRQGKRTDLEDKTAEKSEDGSGATCVQPTSIRKTAGTTCVQLMSGNESANITCAQHVCKAADKSRRPTIRDKTAQRLDISASTLSKYRRIIKLPDGLLQSIAHLLDEKRITFEAAYIISNVIDIDIKYLIKELNKHPDWELDLDKLKELPKRNAKKSDDIIYTISNVRVLETFKPSCSPK